MMDRIEMDAVYAHPPERVWRALTDAAALSKWFMPTDLRPIEGFRFRFQRPGGGAIRGKVTEVKEGRRLSFTFRDDEDGQESLVVWSIDPVDSGTRLHVEHRVIEESPVTCLCPDNYFNWIYALTHSLPGLLALLRACPDRMPRLPITYVEEDRSILAAVSR